MNSRDPLFRKFSSALVWTFSHRVALTAIRTVISIALARLLLPGDYGLVAMVTVLTNFLSFTNSFGLNALIVRQPEANEPFLSTIFWFNLATGVFVACLVAGCSPLIARYYGDPRLLSICFAMSLTFVIDSLAIVPESLLSRNFRFKASALTGLASLVGGASVSVPMALWGYGPWSLVAHELTSKTVECTLRFAAAGWRPAAVWSNSVLKESLPFAMNVTGSKVVDYVMGNAHVFLIASFMGPVALGLYSMASRVVFQPVEILVFMLGRAVFPLFANLQRDGHQMTQYLGSCLRVTTIVLFPVGVTLLVAPDVVIQVLLGEKWIGSAPLLRIFTPMLIFEPLRQLVSTAFIAKGEVRLLFRIRAWVTLVTAPAVIASAWLGLEALVASYVIAAASVAVIQIFLFLKSTEVTVWQFLDRWFREWHLMALLALWFFVTYFSSYSPWLFALGLLAYALLVAMAYRRTLTTVFGAATSTHA